MKYLEILKTNSKILDAKLEASIPYNHKGVKGNCREEDLISVIRECLPNCYGLKAGEIFDQNDNVSNQIDVVIYDNVYSNYFKKNSSTSLFPCESVYGSIEVKSYLNKDELYNAIENIKSVRQLKRTDSNMFDITPLRRLNFNDEQFKLNDDGKQNEYVNVIFAYDSISNKSIIKYLEELKDEDFDLLPTFIYVHKKGMIYFKVQSGDEKENIGKCFLGMNHKKNNTYSISNYGEDSLTAFLILLNAMLEQIILKSIDYTEFSNKHLQELKKDIDKILPN